MSVIFFQSTTLGGNSNSAGLFDLLLTHINGITEINVFDEILVIAPDYTMVDYLFDKITLRNGICANIKFEILFGPFLNNIYMINNPDAKLFDFTQAKYIIYNYLCENKLTTLDAVDLNNYIYLNGVLDKYKVFQLANQLQQIFHEYMYLRTHEVVNLEKSNFPAWQKQILVYLLHKIAPHCTFLDVYNYFANTDLNDMILPSQLFVFGLNSVYKSQLEIIKILANKINVYWYYKALSFEYYGDLLSDKAKSKLEKRLLRKPDLCLDDIYLYDSNPLVSNLGQQSREFTELLRANDIEVYSFDNSEHNNFEYENTFLSIIQSDIRNIKYRVPVEYRLNKDNAFYVAPLYLPTLDAKNETNNIYDLPNNQLSLNINICHNKMREVQVMFNEIVNILDKNDEAKLDNILICAPHIEEYSSYINAVFDNEFVQKYSGELYKLPYVLVNKQQDYKQLVGLKIIINAPYNLPVSYLIEILAQSEIQKSLDISTNDFELIKKWLKDNATNFGYNEHDYDIYSYENYSIHSFQQFLNNLILGVCLTEEMFDDCNDLPLYHNNTKNYTPYDNLDYTQVNLCNKLIKIIEHLKCLRDILYVDSNTYSEITISDISIALNNTKNLLLNSDEIVFSCEIFFGSLMKIPDNSIITLPIINLILDEYMNDKMNEVNLNGKICCASIQNMRNIPYDYIYILGMNFGEFPTLYNPNQLSLLAQDWALADRNYNIEDKQMFLDVILSTGKQLYISYIGRKENDNSEIKPSSVVNILLNTIGQTFTNFIENSETFIQKFNFKNMVKVQALHPFYKNMQVNFSTIWRDISAINGVIGNNLRWNFNNMPHLELTNEQKKLYFTPKLKDIFSTFLYANTNLYKTLNLILFNNEIELNDNENLVFTSVELSKAIFAYFNRYLATSDESQLTNFLITKGILSYEVIGKMQFDYYKELYQNYINNRGISASLEFNYTIKIEDINLVIQDILWIQNDKIIIMDDFSRIKTNKLNKKLCDISYSLRIKALIICSLIRNGALINNENAINMQIVIRQMNIMNEIEDIIVDVINMDVLDKIMNIYMYSLTSPLLVHQKAICKYADVADGQKTAKAFEAYSMDYHNYDLDKLKKDVIYAPIADEYFEFTHKNGIQNDIFVLGNSLENLTQI